MRFIALVLLLSSCATSKMIVGPDGSGNFITTEASLLVKCEGGPK